MSTPLRRSRSITKKDKDKCSPGRAFVNPLHLFDLCVDFILQSNDVASKAVIHLPHIHAQYLLCLALKRLREGKLCNSSILHTLITGWHHADLSFNFRTNPLVIKRLGSLQPVGHSRTFGCIEPHIYHGIGGVSKSRYSSCAREIAIGLFNHVYHHDQLTGGGQLGLKTVDLSNFEQFSSEAGTSYLDTEPAVTPFYQLTRGTFPGRDAYECLSPEDFKFYRTRKPVLRKALDQPPVKLYVSFKFTTISHVMEFVRLSKVPNRYKLCLRALDLGSLEVSSQHSHQLDELDNSDLTTLITRSSNSFSDAFLANLSCLWVLQTDGSSAEIVRQVLRLSGNLKTLFVSLLMESSASILEAIAETAITNGHTIQALGLFGGETKSNISAIVKCLTKLNASLQYLQLYDWTPSNVPLKPLSTCHQLRVLSIVVDCSHLFSVTQSHSIGELFETLGNLKKLEYIELGEQIDLQAPDLVHIQQTLKKSLLLLEHCHLNFNYISLKRADLDESFNQPIYQLIRSFFMIMGRGTSLLYRQTENFHLTLGSSALSLTRRWLTSIRQGVCFKIGAETSSVSSLVHLRRLGM